MELFFDSKKNSKKTEQAEVYKNLKEAFKDNLNTSSLSEFCIINKEWYRRWKKALPPKQQSITSINYLNSPLQTSNREITNHELGSMVQLKGSFQSFEDIFTSPNYFFIQSREMEGNNKDIFIIDEEMKFNIKIISKEMWNYFYGVYGGGPRIHRYVSPEALKQAVKKKLLLCNYVFYKKIAFFVLSKSVQGKFDFNLFNKQEHYLYISNDLTTAQVVDYFVKVVLEQLNVCRCKLWRLEEEKKIIFVNWIRGKMALFNSNSQTNFTGELIDSKPRPLFTRVVYPQFSEFSESDFFIIEICLEREEEQGQKKQSPIIQPFFLLKEKKHFLFSKCSFCSKNTSLNYTCQCKTTWFCSLKCFEQNAASSKHKCHMDSSCKEVLSFNGKSLKGVVGIKNLGNTCYMNAAIQCLSNIHEISGYFLSKSVKSKGDLFKQFSQTLLKLHFGSDKAISIHSLRTAIGKKNPVFLANTQEDSEEFLMTIINSLHEELNKAKKAATNTSDKSLTYKADYQKQNNGYNELVMFMNSNNSVIANLFVGEFRSSIQCFKCKSISYNFDIFFCLSLPIPVKNEVYVDVYFVYFDISKGIAKLPLVIECEMFVVDLRNLVSNMLNINPMSFIIGTLTYFSIDRLYHNMTPLSEVFASDDRQSNSLSIVTCFQFDSSLFSVSENKFHKNDKLHDSFNNSTIDTECFYKKVYLTDLNTEPHETFYTQVDPSFIEIYNSKDFFTQSAEVKRVIQNISNTIEHTLNSDKTLKQQAQKILMNTLSTSLLVYTDENYGFNSNYLKVFLRFKVYCDGSKRYPFRRKEVAFQRVVYVNIKWSLLYLHKYLSENFAVDNSVPEIRIVNPNKNKCNSPCFICNDTNCVNCLLSDVKGIATIENIFNLYPMNINKPIDNAYLYYDLPSRKLTVARYDFELELCYQLKNLSSVTKTLNQLKPLSMKQESLLIKPNSKKDLDIYDCLKKFSQKEILEGGNLWFCSKCNSSQKAVKKIQINYSPNILIIQLKRFKIGGNVKIDNFVNFAVKDFQLKNYNVIEQYDLCGIINHTGTLGFGHYVACCRNSYDGKWYRYDDSTVTEVVDEKELVSSSAYVLFYKKKTFTYDKAKALFNVDKSGLELINEAFAQYMINYISKNK